MDGSRGEVYSLSSGVIMWWNLTPQLIKRIEALEDQSRDLKTSLHDLSTKLAETSHGVRQIDLDMVGLEDKVKAFTGRISVAKRKDRQPEPEPEPELDLNQAIRDGKVSSWPLAH